jgi:hypothetical protein
MKRRNFLKLSGIASIALLAPVGLIVKGIASITTVKVQGKTFHGSDDGKVYVSRDDGQNWERLANFGPGMATKSFTAIPGARIYARFEFAGNPFALVYSLNDGQWRTA